MNILDENITIPERKRLLAKRIHVRQIGLEIGHLGMKDVNEIIPLLHKLRKPTLFTRDHGFYKPSLRHPGYCMVLLDIPFDEVADYVQRFLRHPQFRAQAQRMGKVIRVRYSGISFWQVKLEAERILSW